MLHYISIKLVNGDARIYEDGSVTLNGKLTDNSSYWSSLSYNELQDLVRLAKLVKEMPAKE